MQPPANILKNLADMLGISIDFLISRDIVLLQKSKEIFVSPDEVQGVLIKEISAYIRDFRAKQPYGS